jgi:hypothetical protein
MKAMKSNRDPAPFSPSHDLEPTANPAILSPLPSRFIEMEDEDVLLVSMAYAIALSLYKKEKIEAVVASCQQAAALDLLKKTTPSSLACVSAIIAVSAPDASLETLRLASRCAEKALSWDQRAFSFTPEAITGFAASFQRLGPDAEADFFKLCASAVCMRADGARLLSCCCGALLERAVAFARLGCSHGPQGQGTGAATASTVVALEELLAAASKAVDIISPALSNWRAAAQVDLPTRLSARLLTQDLEKQATDLVGFLQLLMLPPPRIISAVRAGSFILLPPCVETLLSAVQELSRILPSSSSIPLLQAAASLHEFFVKEKGHAVALLSTARAPGKLGPRFQKAK